MLTIISEELRNLQEYNLLRSVEECALYMGVTPAQVRVWQETGYLPYTQVGTGKERRRKLSSFHDCDVCLWNTKKNRGLYKAMGGKAI